MSFFDKILLKLGLYKSQKSPLVLKGVDSFGVQINNESALKITALYAGIRLRAENLASFPKRIIKRGSNGKDADFTHPAFKLIALKPNQYTNKFNFWNCIATWLDGYGNAYAWIERDSKGDPIALHQIHPSRVTCGVVSGKKFYNVAADTELEDSYVKAGVYSDENMLHFMLMTLDGVNGVNPIIYNALTLCKSLATEKFASDFFAKGGNIRAVLESDGHLGDDEFVNFMQHFKNSSQNFETPFLEYGIKYKQLAIDPVAEQLISSEILSIQDVCRILNIPPHMIAELSHATFSNIEHQSTQFVLYSLRPTVKRIETELESKLFTTDEQAVYEVKFKLEGLLRGDTASRSAYYHNAILDGYMSRNEVRELEGLPKKDGLDKFLYPLNTGIIGEE